MIRCVAVGGSKQKKKDDMMSPVGILMTEEDKMKRMKRKETEEKTEERQRIRFIHSELVTE